MRTFHALSFVCAFAVFTITASFSLASSQSPKGDSEVGMSGAVGNYSIAMIIDVRDDVKIISAHYSYAKKKIRIPLTGRVNGEHVLLSEPGGASFDLHLITNSTAKTSPITFWTATGLEGTWRKKSRNLPVKLGFVFGGPGTGGILDCELYPAASESRLETRVPRFPNPGCTHTPDKSVLDRCIARPFTTSEAVVQCVTAATATCHEDQMDMNFCIGNVSTYLDETVQSRLRVDRANKVFDAQEYRTWTASRTSSCEKNSAFSPDGSGYGADISFCMSFEMMRLLQAQVVPSPEPFVSSVRD